MENFGLHPVKLVGTPTLKSGSWVHTFTPSESEKLARRGHFLAVIGLTDFSGEGDLAVVGKEIISRLHEEYYGDLTAEPFKQLKKTIEKITKEVSLGASFNLNLGVVALVGHFLYGVVSQGGRLLVNRQGEIKTIFKGEENGSGYLQSQDVFLLGTEEFFRLVGQEAMETALRASSPEETVEILAPAIHGQPDGSSAGIVFRIFSTEPKKEGNSVSLEKKEEILPQERKKIEWGKILKEKFTNLIIMLDEKIKRKTIYLKAHQEKSPRSQKTLFTVALLLLIILGVSVFFGMKQRKNAGFSPQAVSLLEQARSKKEEGEALKTLNPAKSQQLLNESLALVGEIEKLGGQNEEFLKFKQGLANVLAGSLQEYQVEGEFFFDLELIKAEAKGDQLLLADDQLVVLDKSQKAVYQIGLADKKSTILFGGEKFEGIKFLSSVGEDFYVLTNDGILKGNKLSEIVIPKDEDWGEITAMAGFSGSLYLLDKSGEIWKYPITEEGFGTKQKWLKESVDLSLAKDLAIDGSLWVLNQNGQIFKFLQGNKDAFALSGLNKPLLEPAALFTDFESENLYVLDKGNARVVVLDKSGESQAQYNWVQASGAQDLVFQESEKRLFLLSGSKIYQLSL
jgi:hypothetical protein